MLIEVVEKQQSLSAGGKVKLIISLKNYIADKSITDIHLKYLHVAVVSKYKEQTGNTKH